MWSTEESGPYAVVRKLHEPSQAGSSEPSSVLIGDQFASEGKCIHSLAVATDYALLGDEVLFEGSGDLAG